MSARWFRWVGIVLLGIVPLVGGQAWGQTPAPSQPQLEPRSQPRMWARHGRPLMGTVASVSNGSVVLTTWTGRSVTVQTTSATRVLNRVQANLSDLQSGDMVRVMATKAADGSLSARAVFATPATSTPATSTPATGPGGRANRRVRGGLWGGNSGMVMIAGRLTGAPANGVITVALPAGSPLSVTVPSTARLTRLVSMPVSGLASGTHVLVQGRRNADGSITAAVMFVVGTAGK